MPVEWRFGKIEGAYNRQGYNEDGYNRGIVVDDDRLLDVPECTLAYNRFARSATVELDDPDGTIRSEYPRGAPVGLEVKSDTDTKWTRRLGGFVNGYEQGQQKTKLKLLSHDAWLRSRDVYRGYGPGGSTAHLRFGSGDDVTVTNASELQITDDLTIAFEVRPTDVAGARQNPIGKAYGGEFALTQETDGRLNYYHGPDGGNSSPYMNYNAAPAGTFEDGEEHTVAITRDVDTRTLATYIDGEKINERTFSEENWENPGAGANDVLIGNGYKSAYRGGINDVRLYNETLTAKEAERVTGGVGVNRGLVAHWKFDDGSGTTATDSAGANDGTVNGAVWVTDDPMPYDRGASKAGILVDLIDDLTPLEWDRSRVDVYDNSRIDAEWSGVPLDKAVDEIAGASNDEIFGATDDQTFFFEQRDTSRSPRDFTAGEYFAGSVDFKQDGNAELNEVTVYYGGQPASSAVVVDDRESQKQLQDELGADRPVVISDSKTYTDISTEATARRKGREILEGASAIQTGELTTWEAFTVEPGDVAAVEVPEQDISGEFRVAEIAHSWQDDETTVKLAENSQGVVDTLVELSDEVSRVDARAADNNATITRFTRFDFDFVVDFELSAWRRQIPDDQLLFGRRKGGWGDPQAGGGLWGDQRGDREQIQL